MQSSRSKVVVGAIFAVTALLCVRLLVRAITEFQLDLDVYRWGGHAIGTGSALYGDGVRDGLPFTYTPIAALLFVPIGFMPQTLAQFVWTSALLIALFVFIRESVMYVAPRLSKNATLVATVSALGIALLIEPIRHNFGLGQINILLATAILLDLRGRTGKIPTGVLIGICAAVKLTPLIFVAYLFLSRRWRAGFISVAAVVAATGVGAAAAWDQSWEYWTKLAFDAGHVGGIPYVANQSIYGVMSRLLDGVDNADVFFKPVAAVVGVAGLALAVAVRRVSPALGDIACAFTGLLLSPISWSHHWVWVIPAALWFVLHEDATKWARCAVAAAIGVFALGPIWWVPKTNDVEFDHYGWQLVAANCYLPIAVGFLAAIAFTLYRSYRPAGGQRYVPGRGSELVGG